MARDPTSQTPYPSKRSRVRRAVDETTERLLEIVDEVFGVYAKDRAESGNGTAGGTPTKERLRAITEMADSMVERGDLVRKESEHLLELLAERVRDLNGVAGAEQRPHARTPPPALEEAVLHATKMAVTGASRNAIADSLAKEFGVREPHKVIESILGPAERP